MRYHCQYIQIIGDMEINGGDGSDKTAEKIPQQR
jgi:hypothetical protein